MKYLTLLLLLTGCGKFEDEHVEAEKTIRAAAEIICSCHNGIKKLKVYRYGSIPDTGILTCNDGFLDTEVDTTKFACGKVIE